MISVGTYLCRVLAQHDWLTGDTPSRAAAHPLPMSPDSAYLRRLDEAAPPPTDSARRTLKTKMGFSYHQGINELIWAMVTCRPNIFFAAVKLSQYSVTPAREHYIAVKNVFRYLRATIDDGLIYCRRQPATHLPLKPCPMLKSNPHNLLIHDILDVSPSLLCGFVDSDWATDMSHRRSVTGMAFLLAGGTVAFKTRYQLTVTLSSTEAKFMAACNAGKIALYVCSILNELGIPQEEATLIHEYNAGAILMANDGQPTRRMRHIDMRHFTLLDWIKQDLISLAPVATAKNPSDVMTKALVCILSCRHTDVLMGCVLPYFVQ